MKSVGPYRLDAELGAGGMAEVWLATHRKTGHRVALKLLKVSSPELFKEARAHARLNHQHIVRLYDYGEEEVPFLSMERMDGTLRDLLPLTSYAQCRRVLEAVLTALAFAHARGVIHRDIKPENILFKTEGEEQTFKLADFGIAHALGESALNQDIHASAGTPLYMAPEQFYGDWRDLGPWTDLYAVGCLAFELITGDVPFQGSNLAQLAFKHLQQPVPKNVPTLFPVPSEIWNVIELLSRKQARERMEHAADAIAVLPEVEIIGLIPPEHSAELAAFRPVSGSQDTEDIAMMQTELNAPFFSEPAPSPTAEARPIIKHIPHRVWNGSMFHEAQLDTDGLGLFGLRDIPVVGLDRERDALWNSIVALCTQGITGNVWLQSDHPDTASRLARWVSTHAAEIGAVQVFEVVARPTGGVREGLVGLSESLLRAWRATPDEVMTRAKKFGSNGETLARDILGRVHGQHDLLPGRTEKFKATIGLLCELAQTRPIVLIVSGIEYDTELAEWLELVMSQNAPLLAMICAQSFNIPNSAKTLPIPGLTLESTRKMLKAMLPVSDSLSEVIAQISGQDGEFAHQMVSDLVERGALEVDRNRLILAAEELLPTTPDELFMRRLDRVLRALGQDAVTSEAALEIAAALGTAPEPDELQAICRIAKVPFPAKLIRTMLDAGLLRGDESGWYFVHPALLRCVRQRAENRGRWTTWHLLCAEHLLASAHPDMPSELWSRIGWHYVEAQEARRALEPMYRAVTQQTGSLKAAKSLAAQREEILAAAGVGAAEPESILQSLLHALFQRHEGETSKSIMSLKSATEACRLDGRLIPGFEYAGAECLKSLGTTSIALNPKEAQQNLKEAEEIFARLGYGLEAASCAFGQGFIAMSNQNQSLAESLYRKAADGFLAANSRRRRAQVLSYLAHCLTSQGRHDEASEVLVESVGLARQLHDRYSEFLAETAHSTMLRHLDDYQGARVHAESAMSLARGLGAQDIAVASYNLVVLHLRERPEDHISEFEHVLELYSGCELNYRTPVIEFALGIARGDVNLGDLVLPKDDPEVVWLSKVLEWR